MKSRDITHAVAVAAKPLIRPEEAMAQIGCGRTYLYELLASGEIKSVKVGRLRRILQDSVDEYVQRLNWEQNGGAA